MLSVQCEPPVQTAFPSVHAFIMLEGTMNLTGEMQPLVEQLMMIKRIQVGLGFITLRFSGSQTSWVYLHLGFSGPAYSSTAVRPGDLESLLHRAHRVSRRHGGTQVDRLHLSQGLSLILFCNLPRYGSDDAIWF